MAKVILVVDDDPGMLDLCKLALETVGYEVICAISGDEALAKYTEHQSAVSLVLMDYSMPGMNGVETAIALRGINPEVKVSSFTGTKNQEVLDLLDREKMTPILAKPFGLTELVDLIENQVGVA